MSQIFIETPRLILRQWEESDYDPFIAMGYDKDVMEYFPSVLTDEESLAAIQRVTNHIIDYGYGFFAVERKDNHQFIGFTGLSHPRFESYFTPCVEIGWRLSKANWGKGFATEAAIVTLDFAFNMLNLDTIYSFTAANNLKSQNVMQKIGMKKDGLFEHPMLEDGHPLKPHVLFKITGGYPIKLKFNALFVKNIL